MGIRWARRAFFLSLQALTLTLAHRQIGDGASGVAGGGALVSGAPFFTGASDFLGRIRRLRAYPSILDGEVGSFADADAVDPDLYFMVAVLEDGQLDVELEESGEDFACVLHFRVSASDADDDFAG